MSREAWFKQLFDGVLLKFLLMRLSGVAMALEYYMKKKKCTSELFDIGYFLLNYIAAADLNILNY